MPVCIGVITTFCGRLATRWKTNDLICHCRG